MSLDPCRAVESAIVERIKADRLGSRAVKLWPTANQLMPPDREVTQREVPAVRVEVTSGGPPRRVEGEGGPIERPMLASITTWVEGPGNDKSLYLWAIIEKVFDPVNAEERDALDDYLDARSIWSVKIEQAAIPTAEMMAAKVVRATGILEVSYWDETP